MKKRILIFGLFLICIFSLVACGKQSPTGADLSKTYMDDRELISEANNSDFVLTTSNGYMELYDVNGKKLDTLNLGGTSKSKFIYCQDEGEVYSRKLLGHTNFTSIFYAVDKADGKLYIISNSRNKLKLEDTKSLKVSNNIDEIRGFNGLFFYSEKGNGISSKKFTVNTLKDTYSGIVDYMKEVGVERRGKTYTFIHTENFTKDYLKWTGLDSKVSDADIANMNMATVKRECVRIPYDVHSWDVTNNSILYFAEEVYGSYELDTNILTACYGTPSSIGASYRVGRFSSCFALNQMGEHSEKSILFQIDPSNLDIKKALEFEENIPIDIYVDSSSNILYMAYKLDNKSTYGKIKIYDLTEEKEINNITLDFVPTMVKGHNGYYYAMNEFESFMAMGSNNTKEYTKVNKIVKEHNANNVLLCNVIRKDYFLYDGQSRFIDENGYLLDYRGNLVDIDNRKINKYGQLLDAYGRAINSNGELVDKYGNLIDENGVIIKYTKQADGYYRSSKGIVVDSTGKAMIRQEDGTYIKDVEKIPDLEWHYDENGNVVINQDYLDKYPDAASWIGKDGTITKGSYYESTDNKDKNKK